LIWNVQSSMRTIVADGVFGTHSCLYLAPEELAMKKIPSDAFDFYFSLGPARSYQAVVTASRATSVDS
jgi:hypothetical protein